MPIKTSLVNILNNPNKSFIQSAIIDPHKNQAEKAGTLFVLSEINQPSRIAEKIIFIISQLLEKNYYLNEKIFLAEQLNSLKIEAIFESALVKSNRELLEFIDQQKINFNFKTLNIIVGLIYEEQIHFSSMGQNKSFLINKNNDNWQISDINPSNEEHEIEELASGKIFSSIISGELPENSYIIFSNPSLSQYLLSDEFIKIIGELKLEGATEQIKNYLKKINNYSNFCGLLIKNISSGISNDIKYYDSDLINTEKKTERLLTVPGSINTKKTIKKISHFLDAINIFKSWPKTIRKIFKKIKTKKEKNIEITEHSTGGNKWKNKKILLIIAGVLLLLLIANLVFHKKEKSEILTEENASSFEDLIEQKQNQIDSALLYNNEARAKEIIEELQVIIESLSDKDKNKIKNYSEIEEKINDQVAKIQKIIKLSNPKEITNFSNLNQEADTMAIAHQVASSKIYAIDGKNNYIYLLNLNDNVSSNLSKNNLISGSVSVSANSSKNNSYFIIGDQVVTINEQEQISFNKIDIENKENISSFDIYNNRPYLVDKKQNKIIRYNKSNDTFSSPTNWLKDATSINVQSIAIDYSIYILTQEGEVKKYLEGSPESFSTDKIEPPLEKADYLKIGDRYIFVVDKSGQRIIVFYKENGLFINQYYSDKFDNIKDIAIDEKNNKIYILNNNSVYEIDIIL